MVRAHAKRHATEPLQLIEATDHVKKYVQEMIARQGMYWDILLQANNNGTGC